MNLEEAIRWYFTDKNKERADKKIPSLAASNPIKTGEMKSRGSEIQNGMNGCLYCGNVVPAWDLDLGGHCTPCRRIVERESQGRIVEVRSGYRGDIRAQYVTTNLSTASTYTQSATGGFINPKYVSAKKDTEEAYNKNRETYLEALGVSVRLSDRSAELEAQIKELTEQVEKLKGTGVEASGENDVLITGRKFRKNEEETADECRADRRKEAE